MEIRSRSYEQRGISIEAFLLFLYSLLFEIMVCFALGDLSLNVVTRRRTYE